MKVHLRLDSGDVSVAAEDADPARRPYDALVRRAEEVFARTLEELFPKDSLPARVEISLAFLSLSEMEEQNRKHRDLDEPTDVLSFPMWEEDGEFRPGTKLPVLPLGDILICPEYVRAAAPSEEAFRREMALMLAHGFLHLLAWDHDTDERRSAMEALQSGIQKELLAAAPISTEGGGAR